MREIKFRAWFGDKMIKPMSLQKMIHQKDNTIPLKVLEKEIIFMQYTGLKDKNGVEIYEYMEIDNTYEVSFLNSSYVLTNISNGDIMLLSNYMENHNGKVEITREYTKV